MVVRIPLIILFSGLIWVIVSCCVQAKTLKTIYRQNLIERYNETQGNTDDYLDTLHTWRCCGTIDMEVNVTEDANVFKPAQDMLTRFPRSCCPSLAEKDLCTFERIYKRPCDHQYIGQVNGFYFGTVLQLLLSIGCIFAIHSVYKTY